MITIRAESYARNSMNNPSPWRNNGAKPKAQCKRGHSLAYPNARNGCRVCQRLRNDRLLLKPVSDLELQILVLICQDLRAADIAAQLDMTVSQVNHRTYLLYKKIGVHSSIGALRWGVKNNIVRL